MQGERKRERVEFHLPCVALLLTGTGGGTSNCTWKRIRRGRGDENVFIYAFNLPKDSTLPRSSDSGGLKAVLQNLLSTTSQCPGVITGLAPPPPSTLIHPVTLPPPPKKAHIQKSSLYMYVFGELCHFARLESKRCASPACLPRLYL